MNSSKARTRQSALFSAELLEGRQLLSAASAIIAPATASVASAPTTVLQEKAHVQFTANLGNFTINAPATDLVVSINWGDGKVTSGHLKADGIIGIDQINFEVDGTHTYKHAGTYEIHVTVSRPGLTPNNPFIVAQFHDQAVVTRHRHH